MTLLGRLKQQLSVYSTHSEDVEPSKAYNLWSETYDSEPGNLMLALDEEVFTGMLQQLSLKNKTVVDIGCGTGRHWAKMLLHKPDTLLGYDVSIGMLNKLNGKYPGAVVYHLSNNQLPELRNEQCDTLISTLTVAHIENIEEAFLEWSRVLKHNGEMIITDYHPDAFLKGGNRTFAYEGKTIAIKNHIHPLEKINAILLNNGFELLQFREKIIDDTMKPFFKKKNALHVFEKFRHVPIIYSMHLRKQHAPKESTDH